jgi:hypothetical protein
MGPTRWNVVCNYVLIESPIHMVDVAHLLVSQVRSGASRPASFLIVFKEGTILLKIKVLQCDREVGRDVGGLRGGRLRADTDTLRTNGCPPLGAIAHGTHDTNLCFKYCITLFSWLFSQAVPHLRWSAPAPGRSCVRDAVPTRYPLLLRFITSFAPK